MRIVQHQLDGGWLFKVYPEVRGGPRDLGFLARLIRHVRRAKLPMLLGGSVEEPSLVLTIGPLPLDDALAFQAVWGANICEAKGPDTP